MSGSRERLPYLCPVCSFACDVTRGADPTTSVFIHGDLDDDGRPADCGPVEDGTYVLRPRPFCSHPVQNRNGTLRSCSRIASIRTVGSDGMVRFLCTFHANLGRFRPLFWEVRENLVRKNEDPTVRTMFDR